ncbi:MAG: CBS domain-containing protein [Alphaproteobacteria bacterium]
MKISEVIKSKGADVTTVGPKSSIRSAVGIMKAMKIGALLVRHDSAIVGILSERDVVRALADHGARTLDMAVDELMTRNLTTCKAEDKLTDVMRIMTQRRIRHLPVMEGNQLKGIVSIGDAVKNRLDELEMETNVLRDAYTAVT